MQRRHLCASIAAAPLAAWGQGAAAPSRGDLAQDMALLRDALLALHPGLLRYNTPRQVQAGLDALQADFVGAADLAARYLALSRFLATLRCGHSYANFFNQSRAVSTALFDRPSRLPFTFRWLDGAMVITGDASGSGLLPRGAEVQTVDGMPAQRLWDTLAPYARVDGHNEPKARHLLGVTGRFALEFFDVMHGLVHGPPAGGRFRLDLRLPDGRTRLLEVPALTLAARHAAAPPRPTGDQPVWTWEPTPDGVAVLRMPGWALFSSRWNWRAWLDERLDTLQRDAALRGLVVDLRDNEGGLDCGHPIIERFARVPSVLAARRLVRYRRTPAHLNPVLDTWDDSFRDWGDGARPVDDRFFELPAGPTTVTPRGPRIDKPLVVLVNSANSSATFAFAQRVRQDRLGVLVGEPTGGNQRGINGGAFFFVRLPAVGLEFDLPLIGYFPDGTPPDGGLLPDVAVLPTQADLAAGRDVQLERALILARG